MAKRDKPDQTTTFDSGAYTRMAEEIARKGERVGDRGRQEFRQTGQLHELVQVFGKSRVSRNSFENLPDGRVKLTRGPSNPVAYVYDGTGSMGGNVAVAFNSVGRQNAMLTAGLPRYFFQIASGVVQDVADTHPVFQLSQFEADHRIAEQLNLLIPDMGGGDATEDYDLALWWMSQQVETDLYQHYGLKGHLQLVADEIGRSIVQPSQVRQHLGFEIQSQLTTSAVCRALLSKWHAFYLNVGSDGRQPARRVTSWWTERLGNGRVIEITDVNLLAEAQAGLIYALETAQPTERGLAEFLAAGGQNRHASRGDVSQVWRWLLAAQQHFGAQTRLPGHSQLPIAGQDFAHYRDPWPEGHVRFGENPSQQHTQPNADEPDSAEAGIDWNAF